MTNTYDNIDFFNKYSQMQRSQSGLDGAGEWHQFQQLFPDLTNKVVLDLGCGYGWHCKYAIEQGAQSVLGIDLSSLMINTAKAKNSDEKIQYQVLGLDDFDYSPDTYDCVISNLVLHYVEDLKSIYEKIYCTLKDGGTFVFNIEHPIFTSGVNQDWVYSSSGTPLYWPVDNYFTSGARETHFLGQPVTKQHHTLTQILNGLCEANFKIQAIEEAVPAQSMLHIEGMKDELRRPMMLMVKAVKSNG